ncbi:hypothetical protein BT96DRAFT_1014059 [Gymnopus androsaceus JB14]|uniref:Conserved oligomeric Golgi complex subunit 8 n=1 Tax=Gymnopus androsaceus JB14 TaxID=1447944 RepID=A0A6A4ICI8_9AGAR|nr:hypothetical protein BT96DRAFT_1014059 [Gymnopus androsaceus JB14]
MFFFILCSIVSVLGQTTHMVSVGDNGSFYNPPTVAAGLNDIVTFVFTGQGSHGVAQSTYSDPCTPLSGGFNSGLYSLSNSTNPNEAPVWSIQITDDVDPIYFFCPNTHPVSHCGSGMVGVINTPSQANYSTFVVLAKGTTTTITSQPPYAATGSGAFALATPTLLRFRHRRLPQRQRPLQPPMSTLLANHTPEPLIGGAVGGCLVVGLVIIAVVYMLLRRHRQQQPQSAPPQQSPNYYTDRQLPPGAPGIMERGMGERGKCVQAGRYDPDAGHVAGSSSFTSAASSNIKRTDSDPVRNNPGHSRLLSHPSSDQMSLGSSGVGAGMETGQQKIGGKDVNTLAKEIAAVLIQNNAAAEIGANFAAVSSRTMSPPHYQAEQLLDYDIPLLINTCVRNSSLSEVLSLASHARGLIAVYPTPPLILTSVPAEVDVAINHMLVSLVTTLHEPNRKLPALWKAVNFLRKMEGAFGGEEEIALAFLSGRELCLKGSLESLRRDIFRIIAVDGEPSARDKEDLAKYLAVAGLWREGHVLHEVTRSINDIRIACVQNHLIPLLTSSQFSKPPIASLSMSSLPPLVTQLTYCAAALARVGAEFRPTVAHCVSDAVTCIFISNISLVEKRFLSQFKRSVQSKKSSERKVNLRSPSTWLLFAEALESNQLPKSIPPNPTTKSHAPPSLLTSYPPLTTHANEIIEVFNALRACAPISAARGYQYFSDCSADGKGNGDIGHEELQDQNLISPTDGLGILEIFGHLLVREGRVIFDYVIVVLELEESLVGDSSSRVSMKPHASMPLL